MKKRVLSCFLSASLLLTAIPSAVFADENSDTISDELQVDITDGSSQENEEQTDEEDFSPIEDDAELIVIEEDETDTVEYDGYTIIESGTLGENTKYTIICDSSSGEYELKVLGKGVIETDIYGEFPWSAYSDEIRAIEFGKGITEIPDECFISFSNLYIIAFPETLEKIGDFSFAGCTALEDLDFTDNVESIGNFAFQECTSLCRLFLNDSLLSIGTAAFYHCTSLDSLTLGPDLEIIGENAFGDCSSLEIIDVYNRDTVFEYGDGFEEHPFTGIEDLTLLGYKNSTAEAFANAHNYTFIPYNEFNPESTDITQLPNSVAISFSKETTCYYYSFIAEDTDHYIIRNYLNAGTPDTGVVPTMVLYTEEGIRLDDTFNNTWPDGYNEIYYPVLEKGRTYYVLVYQREVSGDPVPVDCTLYISQMNPSINPESMDSIRVNVLHNRDATYSFVPDKTGWYSFNSKSSDLDPTITIKKGDEVVGSNDNVSADDKNFSMKVRLTAGTEYSVVFGSADQSTGIYDVSITYCHTIILLQPSFAIGGVGSRVEFHLDAEGVKSFQWQYQKAGTTKWITSTATGCKTDTLSLKISSSNQTNLYRCKIVGTDGSVIYSDPVGIDLIPAVKITKQPESQAVVLGDYVTYRVEAENTSVVATPYQWQYSKDGVKWYNSSATGSTTNTLTVKSSKTNRSYYYRCAIMGLDGNKKYTSKVGMVILTKNPVPCSGKIGVTAEFSVKTNEDVSYQWQYSKDYNKWYSSSASGATTDTMQVKESSTNQYYSYRCKLTRADGIAAYTYSVGFNSNTWIESLPVSVTAGSKTKVTFSVVANGVENYQWQWSQDGMTWTTCTAAVSDESSIAIPVNETNKAYKYRCRLEDPFGGVVYTNAVSIS